MTYVPAGGGGGGASNTIWQWDGTLGQFTDGATPEVDSGAGGVLSVVTGRFNQPVLRVASGVGAGFSSWAIKTSEFSGGPPSRYVMEMMIDEMDDGVGGKTPSSRVGFSHFCQYNGAGNILAYSLCQYGSLPAYFQVWTRNTTFGSSGGTPPGRHPQGTTARGAWHRIEVVMDLSGTFDMETRADWQVASALVVGVNNDATQLDFDAGRFDGETPNTFGLAASWVAVAHRMDIRTLRILKHPADVGV